MPKLTANSAARKLLSAKFKGGEVTGKEDPKSVWLLDPIFQEHELANFRTHYNNLRRQNAEDAYSGNGSVLEALGARNTDSGTKRRRQDSDLVVIDDSTNCKPDGSGAELTMGELVFKPLYLLAEWDELGNKTKHVMVAIVLPSGVGKGRFSLHVPDHGETLELSVYWPSPLVDLQKMHGKWIYGKSATDSFLHRVILAFENALRKKRSCASERVTSTARIPLPIQVQTHIERKHNLAWADSSTRMIYVDLKARAEEYGMVDDTSEFEVIS